MRALPKRGLQYADCSLPPQITRIEGLEGCPRLQRLWLFGNKISVIEGLEGCCDLRELWLQVYVHVWWPLSASC